MILSDPAEIKELFTASAEILHPGEGARVLEPIIGSYSVILLDEAPHLEQRRLMLPAFHGERMQRLTGLMRELTEEEVDGWATGVPFPLHPPLQRLTLEIILRAVFGLTEGERIERLRGELRRLLDLLTRPLMLLAPVLMGPERLDRFGPFRTLMRGVDSLIHEEIADRRRAGDLAERSDILSLLLQARDAETGAPMSEAELRDELLTLLVAGHETTANALAWAVERLARHPGKLARLKAEVSAGETGYMEAVVTETLRLRPVISLVARRLTEPVQIGEWLLPAGVTVAPSIYLMHRRPEIYPNPEAFASQSGLNSYQDTTQFRFRSFRIRNSTKAKLKETVTMATKKNGCTPISVEVAILTPDDKHEIHFGLTKGCNPDNTAFWIVDFILKEDKAGQMKTRVEIHVSDENAAKGGDDDKRCTMEARITGHQPVAVTHHAGTLREAITGAAHKLQRSLDHTLGRLDRR